MVSAVTRALALQRLREESPVLALLRQETMPVVAATLGEHLGGQDRALAAAELYDLVEVDLDELRRVGFTLERSARAYCAEWIRAGLLIRRPAPVGRGEVFELSPAGHDALRLLEGLAEPRSAVTESRLTMIINELLRLAHDTDESLNSRLEALKAERDRIEARIAQTHAGDFAPVDGQAAVARLQDLLHQARDVPADFARVRQSMEDLNRRLRHDLIEEESSQGDVLEDIFLGVDRIHDSPEGRSFDAFYSLVMDAESSALFAEAVDALASRSFAADLPSSAMPYLNDYLLGLQDESMEVSRSMGSFSRSLRQFVQSRQFEAFREMAERLRSAQRTGAQAAGALRLLDRMDWTMELTSGELASVGRLSLHVPSEVQAPEEVLTRSNQPVDLGALHALVREAEIDFDELDGCVVETIQSLGAATLAQVLHRHPATQGLASVVGLYVLGSRRGTAVPDAEEIAWTQDGEVVHALISPTYRFEESAYDS